MNYKLIGKITEVFPVRGGTTEKGEWASVEFEVTESNPENPSYPNIGKFDMFKNGEHVKYAKEFEKYNPFGTEVEVEFSLKKNEYTNSKGENVGFYKTSAFKVTKIGESNSQGTSHIPPMEAFNEGKETASASDLDLPF